MNSDLLTALETLQIPMNSTLVALIETTADSVVINAIAALAEAMDKREIPNPQGFLVSAIKNHWVPNDKSSRCLELKLFQQWYPLAQRQGLALASMKTDGGILIYTTDEVWVPLIAMMEKYPMSALKSGVKMSAA